MKAISNLPSVPINIIQLATFHKRKENVLNIQYCLKFPIIHIKYIKHKSKILIIPLK